MILVDERVGSRELLSALRGMGVDAELAGQLDADFAFDGYGPDGKVLVGIERKGIQDLLNSMRSRRLAGHQIGTMQRTYDVCILVVEGYWRRGRGTGMVEIGNGGWHGARGQYRYSEVDRFLCSLRRMGCVETWRTSDEEETAAYIADEYLWWQKEWAEHKTASTIYAPAPARVVKGNRATLFRSEATLVEKWLAQLPGVDAGAYEIAKSIKTADVIAAMTEKEWRELKGIGKVRARQIWEAIHGISS